MRPRIVKFLRNAVFSACAVGFLSVCIIAIKGHLDKMSLAHKLNQSESYAEKNLNHCILGYINYSEIEEHREEIRKCMEKDSEKSPPFSIWCENIGLFSNAKIEKMMIHNRILFDNDSITLIETGDSHRILVRKKSFRDFQDKRVRMLFEYVYDDVANQPKR